MMLTKTQLEHCNVFSGDHQHCMHADGGECICPCDGCEAAFGREAKVIAATFSCEDWAWLEVRDTGDWQTLAPEEWLSVRLLEWMQKEKIDWRAQRTGGGAFYGRVPLAERARIVAWLTEHGGTREAER